MVRIFDQMELNIPELWRYSYWSAIRQISKRNPLYLETGSEFLHPVEFRLKIQSRFEFVRKHAQTMGIRIPVFQ